MAHNERPALPHAPTLRRRPDAAAKSIHPRRLRLGYAWSTICFWYFSALIENAQVAVVREEPMALFTGRLANHAELDHVLQRLGHGWRRERELFGRRRDRDDRLALKVVVNAQNRSSRAAKLLDLLAVLFNEREYLPRRIGCLLSGLLHPC